VEWRGRIGPMDEVTLGEAAELLNLPPGRVADLVDAGVIPARTNCSVIRISRLDIDLYRRRSEAPILQ
jgi:Helix-turn-helix domain